jgi:hypothetical protein
MRYMALYKPGHESGQPPTPEEMGAMGALIEQMMRDGTLVATGGLQPSARGFRVRKSGGTVTVTDGPFSEAKELVGGFAILEVESREHALELTRRFLEVAGGGESEVRPMHDVETVAPRFGR